MYFFPMSVVILQQSHRYKFLINRKIMPKQIIKYENIFTEKKSEVETHRAPDHKFFVLVHSGGLEQSCVLYVHIIADNSCVAKDRKMGEKRS